MPWPDFSELSFGYGFLREFERLNSMNGRFPAAPDFISQAAEATRGYDVRVLSNSTPVFFQFKRSFVLSTRNAREIQNGDFLNPPLYRMHLREKENYRQHIALQELEAAGEAVFYVTSQIENLDELSRCYTRRSVLTNATAVISPREIILPDTETKHHITFKANSNKFRIYSDEGEEFIRKTPKWDNVTEILSERRKNAHKNREALSSVSEQLSAKNPPVKELADRFDDPVIKASVLSYLVLDAHLSFFKK